MDLKPTMREYSDGYKEWHLNGRLHRVDGPAVEGYNENKYWYLNGELHRVDGPAMEYANGNKAWYIYGEWLTLMEFVNHNLVSEETVQEVLTKWG